VYWTGRKRDARSVQKQAEAQRGRTYSPETHERMREGKRRQHEKAGTDCSYGGTLKWFTWRDSVYERDNHTCQMCGSTSKLIAHHIVAWGDDESLRFEVSNGTTLCRKCHPAVHNRWMKRREAQVG
jgi:hypothetical protein